jgi:hypothetical protein
VWLPSGRPSTPHGACALEQRRQVDAGVDPQLVVHRDQVLGGDVPGRSHETRVGLLPDVGGCSRLPSIVGAGRARELIMTGRPIDGTEAERIGLVNRVCPSDELEATTEALVGDLLACAPVAVGRAKRVIDAASKPALILRSLAAQAPSVSRAR